MCDGVLNKPQINGETKLPSAVRGWNGWNDFFRFNDDIRYVEAKIGMQSNSR
jgi:hypothetical protein